MNKKATIIIGGIIVLLVVIIGVTSFLSREDIAQKKQLNNDAIFSVVLSGEEVATYTMEEIQKIGEKTFDANLKTSGKDPIEYNYTGVLLKNILADAGIEEATIDKAIIYAIDGYAVSIAKEKLLEEDNIYLAYMRENELIGSREEGGKGPYQMIISKDQFSQYWCKYAFKIEIN